MATMRLETIWAEDLPRRPIIAGPGLFDLNAAFMLSHADPVTGRAPVQVRFDLDGGLQCYASITSMEHENSIGTQFFLTGTLSLEPRKENSMRAIYPFQGLYDVQLRNGWLRIGESGREYFSKLVYEQTLNAIANFGN